MACPTVFILILFAAPAMAYRMQVSSVEADGNFAVINGSGLAAEGLDAESPSWWDLISECVGGRCNNTAHEQPKEKNCKCMCKYYTNPNSYKRHRKKGKYLGFGVAPSMSTDLSVADAKSACNAYSLEGLISCTGFQCNSDGTQCSLKNGALYGDDRYVSYVRDVELTEFEKDHYSPKYPGGACRGCRNNCKQSCTNDPRVIRNATHTPSNYWDCEEGWE